MFIVRETRFRGNLKFRKEISNKKRVYLLKKKLLPS